MPTFAAKVSETIATHHLLKPDEVVLVALSGGADSVALLRVLLQLGYLCQAAHCNFHLRGSESDGDAQFVRQLCQQMGVTLHVADFDTTSYAAKQKVSIEVAARELRYNYFAQLLQNTTATKVAVAHHLDDTLETMLMNLMRGTGIDGLTGIPLQNGYVTRPLSAVTRTEILHYLTELHQPFVTDSSNATTLYTRNKIRNQLLPLMATIFPEVKHNLCTTLANLQRTQRYYKAVVDKQLKAITVCQNNGGFTLPKQALRNCESPEVLLFEALHPLGFNPTQITQIAANIDKVGTRTYASPTWQVITNSTSLIVTHCPTPPSPPMLCIESVVVDAQFVLPRNHRVACIDKAKVTSPLTIRLWQQGDRFVPLGMKGSKLVSDYMTDRKFSPLQKQQQWVVCHKDHIVWLVEERIDARFAVTETTSEVLIISCKQS